MDCVRESVKDTLPSLSDEAVEELLVVLDAAGVTGMGDLEMVEADDLTSITKIQARRLLKRWKSDAPSTSNMSFTESDPSPSSPLSLTISSVESINTNINSNWHHDFPIPWTNIKKSVLARLEKGERLKQSDRLNIVHAVIEDVMEITRKPGKKALSTIAARIVSMYPSLKDTIGRAESHSSISKQLIARVENENRKKGSRKRSHSNTDTYSSDSAVLSKSRRFDSYGCVDFAPPSMPKGENEETLEAGKLAMKQSFATGSFNDESKQKANLELTYFSQRSDILKGEMKIAEMKTEWPFLFTYWGMCCHFEKLTAINMSANWQQTVESNLPDILIWMHAQTKYKIPRLMLDLAEVNGRFGNKTADFPGALLAVMLYFKESTDCLFPLVKESATKEEVEEMDKIPTTPCVIFCGDDHYTAKRFLVTIDKVVINDASKSFLNAVAFMMGSYFIFNIAYPSEGSLTLEFLQRSFLQINPEKGSKAEKRNGKNRASGVHARIITLIREIADCKWIQQMA